LSVPAAAEAELDPWLPDLLHRWLPQQRWYPAKGRGVSLRSAGSFVLPDPSGQAHVQVQLVALDSGDRVDVVQIPLTYRVQADPALEHALLGTVEHATLGRRWVYDGPHDPAFVAAWLRLMADRASVGTTSGYLVDGASVDPSVPGRVLRGEQSNTSVIVEPEPEGAGEALIVKVFRVLGDGPNPDVEVTAALAAAGVRSVPRVAGWVEGRWSPPGATAAAGHLAVATEFLAGSRDAWREALEAAADGRPFDEQAQALGAATAQVHLALREAFGTTPMDAQVRADLVAALRDRVRWAVRSSDALEPLKAALASHGDGLEQLLATDLPDLQRVHGDLHLGQVLHAPGRGWVLLDFEGEPLRPLAERTRPDVPLRDVVGMLRSFDYAAGHVLLNAPEHAADVRAWAQQAQRSFVEGYSTATGTDLAPVRLLMDALWVDKALYEVVYETRNRPAWIDIPLAAVRQVVQSGTAPGAHPGTLEG